MAMTASDDIKRLCDLSGASYEKAGNVYESSGGDFYSALGKLRSEGFDGNGFAREQYTQNNSQQYSRRSTVGEKSIIDKFLESYLLINDKSRIPLFVAALVTIFGFQFVIPGALIALLCGVKFTLEGPLFDKADEPSSFSREYTDQGIAYEMPKREPEYEYARAGYSEAPKYNYNYDYSQNYDNQSENGGRYADYEHDISEEKGFF